MSNAQSAILEKLVEEVIALRQRVAALETMEQPGQFQKLVTSGGLSVGAAATIPPVGQIVHRTNCIRAVFTKALEDNTPTAVFTITTTNEPGYTDCGSYSVLMHILVDNGLYNSGSSAVKMLLAAFARTINGMGSIGVNTAVTKILETESVATSPANRNINGPVAITITETSEYCITVSLTADHIGTLGAALRAVVTVELNWCEFLHPPVLAAA